MNKVEYPKYLFHATLPAVIVEDPAEQAALGEGWEETPAAFDEATAEAVPETLKKTSKKK